MNNQIWAVAMVIIFGGAGSSVMFGYIPWTESDVSLFSGLAKLAQRSYGSATNFDVGSQRVWYG